MYSALLELDLATIVPCVAGPKRPHDMVPVADLKSDFLTGLTAPVRGRGESKSVRPACKRVGISTI